MCVWRWPMSRVGKRRSASSIETHAEVQERESGGRVSGKQPSADPVSGRAGQGCKAGSADIPGLSGVAGGARDFREGRIYLSGQKDTLLPSAAKTHSAGNIGPFCNPGCLTGDWKLRRISDFRAGLEGTI